MQGRASAKVAGNPPVVHIRPSGRCCNRRYSGPQRIRNGNQRFHHEGWKQPLAPGESGSPFHRRIDHHIWLALKSYTEGNRVLDGGSMVGYMQV